MKKENVYRLYKWFLIKQMKIKVNENVVEYFNWHDKIGSKQTGIINNGWCEEAFLKRYAVENDKK